MQIMEYSLGTGMAHLTAYIQEPMPADPEDYRMPAVVVFPGGGYEHLAPKEGEPIAMEFAAAGYQTFVLYYSLAPERYPAPLLDGARALSWIRTNAEQWHVDPDKIAVCGFSAGGHAAALLSCLWKEPVIAEAGISNESARPNAAILGYPVITSRPGICHEDSFRALLGEACEAKRAEMSLETRVSQDNPPTFLWHTAADQLVPVESSILMSEALADNQVPFELHIFPQGRHGLALANRRTSGGSADREYPEVAQWIGLCKDWLRRLWEDKNNENI